MNTEDEIVAIEHIRADLTLRFRDVPPEIVEAAVLHEHRSLTGPIRSFVPLLVHKAAVRRLLALTADDRPQAFMDSDGTGLCTG